MAVYDSALTADLDRLRAVLDDELPVSMQRTQTQSSSVTSASTTPVQIAVLTLTGVTDDELIEIIANGVVSSTVTTDLVELAIHIGGTSVRRNPVRAVGATSVTIPYTAENQSGTVVVEFYIHRSSGSGTCSVGTFSLDTKRSKKRA